MSFPSTIRLIDGERCRRCGKCGEFLPDTKEFFYSNPQHDGFKSPCKACVIEKKQHTNATRPCCVPGCTNPRRQRKSGLYDYRCAEHTYHKMIAKLRRERLEAESQHV